MSDLYLIYIGVDGIKIILCLIMMDIFIIKLSLFMSLL
jgi:hypothetical protein